MTSLTSLPHDSVDDFPKFGMTFLQAAYLNVNYDKDEFTVWQAIIGVGNSIQGCAASGAPKPSEPTSASSKSSSGISAGSTAGIVLAVLAFVAVVAAIAIYICIRRRRLVRRQETGTAQKNSFFSPFLHKAELDGQTTTHASMGSSQLDNGYHYQPMSTNDGSDATVQSELPATPHSLPAKQQNVVMEMPA